MLTKNQIFCFRNYMISKYEKSTAVTKAYKTQLIRKTSPLQNYLYWGWLPPLGQFV